MPIKKAKEHYIKRRFNCAQSILAAFQDEFKIEDREIAEYIKHGGGRAPGGVCGAFYAAESILKKHHPDKLDDFRRFILEKAGSLQCDIIRGTRKLSCLGCIEKAAEYVKSCLK